MERDELPVLNVQNDAEREVGEENERGKEAEEDQEVNENANPNAQIEDRTTGLETYLKKTIIGKEILKCYSRCKDLDIPLPPNIRSKLMRLVITSEKDWAFRNTTAKYNKNWM